MTLRLSRHQVPWALAALFAILFAYIFVEFGLTHIYLGMADEQTKVFEQMCQQAVDSKTKDAGANELLYTVWYYPSGTKQVVGSRIDRMVERARRNAVREIIATLRRKTGKDFGEDPRKWCEALADSKWPG